MSGTSSPLPQARACFFLFIYSSSVKLYLCSNPSRYKNILHLSSPVFFRAHRSLSYTLSVPSWFLSNLICSVSSNLYSSTNTDLSSAPICQHSWLTIYFPSSPDTAYLALSYLYSSQRAASCRGGVWSVSRVCSVCRVCRVRSVCRVHRVCRMCRGGLT